MAKYILVISSLLVLVAFLNVSAVADHGNGAEWKKSIDECKAQEGATDEDIKNMKNSNQPNTRGMKCVLTCLAEKHGKIKDGKLNPAGVLNWVKKMPNYNEQMQQGPNEVLEECKNIEDPDRCEAWSKTMGCMMQGAAKRGIKPAFHGQSKM